jgi:hypothetical protein
MFVKGFVLFLNELLAIGTDNRRLCSCPGAPPPKTLALTEKME